MNDRALTDGLRRIAAEKSLDEWNAAVRELDAFAKEAIPILEAAGAMLPAGETGGARVMAWLLREHLDPPKGCRRYSWLSDGNAFRLIRKRLQALALPTPIDATVAGQLSVELTELATAHPDYRGTVERHPESNDFFRLRYYRHEDYPEVDQSVIPVDLAAEEAAVAEPVSPPLPDPPIDDDPDGWERSRAALKTTRAITLIEAIKAQRYGMTPAEMLDVDAWTKDGIDKTAAIAAVRRIEQAWATMKPVSEWAVRKDEKTGRYIVAKRKTSQ